MTNALQTIDADALIKNHVLCFRQKGDRSLQPHCSCGEVLGPFADQNDLAVTTEWLRSADQTHYHHLIEIAHQQGYTHGYSDGFGEGWADGFENGSGEG